MYIIRTIEEILEDTFTDWKDFKLCYVDNIPVMEMDYTPESKEYMKSDQYEKDKKIYGWNNPYIHMEDYPNPNYVEGEKEYYAYFTDLTDLQEQWGDDWNDAPYEHNAGWPYDSDIVEVNENNVATRIEEYDILKVPFAIKSYNYVLPCDNHLNSPWSVQDINSDAVAWIYDVVCVEDGVNGKGQKMYKRAYTTVHAGINPYDFNTKINRINELNKTAWESSRDDEDVDNLTY